MLSPATLPIYSPLQYHGQAWCFGSLISFSFSLVAFCISFYFSVMVPTSQYTVQEFDGSDSGARPDEAVSWGKIKMDATPVKVSQMIRSLTTTRSVFIGVDLNF